MNNHTSRYSFLTRPAALARGNVTAEVTNAIRNAIVSLALPPGSTIDKSLICAELGVSRFPVSEALARLQIEGLVDIAPQRGSTVSLVRSASSPVAVPMRVRTETADRVLSAEPQGGQLPTLVATLPARDSFLDAMAFSRGRFAVEISGVPTLYLPAWPEISRVVEDCR